MDWKLEVVVIPVSDVTRAKAFYGEQVGFVIDHDTRVDDDIHVVQLTPPGSACSIAIGKGIVTSAPGSAQGLQLVVPDLEAARTQLAARGVAVRNVRRGRTGGGDGGRGRGSLPFPPWLVLMS
jgi:catechol 2,3-dioxygenase-like lactoylglutathione lyase family enzyme